MIILLLNIDNFLNFLIISFSFDMRQSKTNTIKPDLNKITLDKFKKDMSCGVAAMKAWTKFMQDTHVAILNFNQNPDLDLFAIFDGHGGSQVAILVQEQFPKQLAINHNFIKENYREALHQTFLKIDDIILSDYGIMKLQRIIEEQDRKGNTKNFYGQSITGCTALVVLFTKDRIYVANCGDSKAIGYVWQQPMILNTEHKPTLPEEQLRIKTTGGFVKQGRILGEINISRCLGDISYKKTPGIERQKQMIISNPQIIEISRQSCQYILLGGDGIRESKTHCDMHKWLKALDSSLKLSEKMSLLLDDEVSTSQDTQFEKDNMTAMIIEFHKSSNQTP